MLLHLAERVGFPTASLTAPARAAELGFTWGAGEGPGGRALPGFIGVFQRRVQLLEALLQRVALVVLHQLLGRTERNQLSAPSSAGLVGVVQKLEEATQTYQQAFELLGFRDVNPVVLLHHLNVLHLLVEPANGSKGTQGNAAVCSSPISPSTPSNSKLLNYYSLNTDGKALGLGRPLPDQVGATDMGLEQVVRLLPLHVPCEPEPRR